MLAQIVSSLPLNGIQTWFPTDGMKNAEERRLKNMGPNPIHSFEKNAPVYLEGSCQEQMDINVTKKLLPSVIKLEREDQAPTS